MVLTSFPPPQWTWTCLKIYSKDYINHELFLCALLAIKTFTKECMTWLLSFLFSTCQVPLIGSLVWLNLRLNPGLPGHWWTLYSLSQRMVKMVYTRVELKQWDFISNNLTIGTNPKNFYLDFAFEFLSDVWIVALMCIYVCSLEHAEPFSPQVN